MCVLRKLWKALKIFDREADIIILLKSRGDTELWEGAADPATDPPPAPGKILTRDKLSPRDRSLNLQHHRKCCPSENTEVIALYWEGANLHTRYFFYHIYLQFLTLTPCRSTLLPLTPLTFISSFSFFYPCGYSWEMRAVWKRKFQC